MLPYPSKQLSACPPPAHGSGATKVPSSQPPGDSNPVAREAQVGSIQPHYGRNYDKVSQLSDPHTLDVIGEQPQNHLYLAFDVPRLDRVKSSNSRPKHKHKHSKSSDSRLPRRMNNITSSAGARGLLPTWTGSKEKNHDADVRDKGDGGLYRPMMQEASLSRWGSESTAALDTGRRMGGLLEGADPNNNVGPIRRHEIRSMKTLEQVRSRRKRGEEYLRSALSRVGSLATDITRRLDYTYYNLLEKIAALNSTISSFQELSSSTAALFDDFQRETSGLDQEIRKQIGELKEFHSQLERIKALEERMKTGKIRADALGKRLEAMRHEIDRWDKKEMEWQSWVKRRLRIFWTVVICGLLTALLAVTIRNWPTVVTPNHPETFSQSLILANSSHTLPPKPDREQVPGSQRDKRTRYSLNYSHCHSNGHPGESSAVAATSTRADDGTRTGDEDPLRMFDEL